MNDTKTSHSPQHREVVIERLEDRFQEIISLVQRGTGTNLPKHREHELLALAGRIGQAKQTASVDHLEEILGEIDRTLAQLTPSRSGATE